MFVLLFTGACTHGDRCSRIHNKPTFSQTVLLSNLYINPQNSAKTADGSHLANVTDEEMQVMSSLLRNYCPGPGGGEYSAVSQFILLSLR